MNTPKVLRSKGAGLFLKKCFYLFWFVLPLLSGCVSTAFLKKDEYLITGQRTKGNKKVETEALELLFRQKANRKVLGSMPYLYAYFIGKQFWDTTAIRKRINAIENKYSMQVSALPPGHPDSMRIERKKERKLRRQYVQLYQGNWLMRTVGEAPAIFDVELAKKTQKSIEDFLFNKGYFDNVVKLKLDTLLGKKIKVTYQITENLPHRVRRVEYRCDDAQLKRIIDSTRSESLLRFGQNYSKERIQLERDRIDQLLRTNGYFGFSREYIVFEIDTTQEDSFLGRRIVDIKVDILNPSSGRHEKFKVSEVMFRIDESSGMEAGALREVRENNIVYQLSRDKYNLKTIDSKLLLRPGEYYNYSKINNSQAQLMGMDMFKFINVSYDTSEVKGKIKLQYYVSRLPRYQISDELGLLVSQGAPGPYINVGFKIRNVFGGFENFESNIRYSEEGQISNFLPSDVIFRSREINTSTSITVSRFLFPVDIKSRFLAYNPKTRYLLSFSNVRRPEYTRNIARASLNYTFQLSQNSVIGVTPTEVSINFAPGGALNQAFRDSIAKFGVGGKSLLQSFNNALVSNISTYYMYNSNRTGTGKTKSYYFRLNLEHGGELLSLFNRSVLRSDNDSIGALQLFRYSKFSADFRRYNPLRKYTILAYKLYTGMAIPYGKNKSVPYEKYFFTGGSNSIKAWAPRRLGPGSYGRSDGRPQNVEQPGEVIIESSVEVRQKLVGVLEGAVFLDGGNIFLLRKDSVRAGGELDKQFYQRMALGTGFGLRLDFSFLVIRFDLGIKAYDPARSTGERWVIRNLKWNKPFGEPFQSVLNFGIGYPF